MTLDVELCLRFRVARQLTCSTNSCLRFPKDILVTLMDRAESTDVVLDNVRVADWYDALLSPPEVILRRYGTVAKGFLIV